MSITANDLLSTESVGTQAKTATVPVFVRFSLVAMIATSSIVMFEPAPCDLAFALAFPFLFLTGHFVLRRPMNPVLCFGVVLFLIMNVISLTVAFELAPALRYFAITVYLVVFSLVIVSVIGRYGEPAYEVIKKAFLFAALVTAIVGILARFQLIPFWEMFMLTEAGLRIRSTFKDANVLGPFLVAATVLVLTDVVVRRKIKVWEVGFLAICLVAIILTFSRGAYLAGAVSWLVMSVLFLWVPNHRSSANAILVRCFPVALLLGLVVIAVLASTGLIDFFLERFSYQSYDDERFLNQQHVIETVGRVPVGIGPGSWNKDNYLYIHDVHSLFLRTWVEHGTIGLLGLLVFLFAWCHDVWKRIARCGKYVHLYIASGAIFWGVMSNSFSIDTVHWRHLFLFLAIPIGLIVYEESEKRQTGTGRESSLAR